MKRTKSYSELIRINSFEKRFEYLRFRGTVGETTFGSDRWVNQQFYRSSKWRRVRDQIIIRDEACDLGVDGNEINDMIIVHHINPITISDLEEDSYALYDPENLICTSNRTHQAIHYSDENLLPQGPVVRRPNDTVPWK